MTPTPFSEESQSDISSVRGIADVEQNSSRYNEKHDNHVISSGEASSIEEINNKHSSADHANYKDKEQYTDEELIKMEWRKIKKCKKHGNKSCWSHKCIRCSQVKGQTHFGRPMKTMNGQGDGNFMTETCKDCIIAENNNSSWKKYCKKYGKEAIYTYDDERPNQLKRYHKHNMTLLSVTDYGKFNSVSCYNGPLASHYQTRPEKQHGKEKEEERIAQMKRKREEEEEEETNDIESISTHMTVAMKAGEKDRTPSGMSSDNTGFKGVGDKTRPGVRFSEDIMVKTEELSEKSDIKIGPDQKDTCKSEQTWIKGYGICSQANNIPQGILPLTQWKDHINPFSTLLIKKEDSQLTDDVEDEDMSEEILIEQFRKFIKKKEMNVQFIVKKLKDLENELSELKVDYKDLLNDSNSVIERLKNELKYCKDELRMAVEAKNKAEEITKDSENHNNKGLVIKDGQLEKVKIELKQLRSQLEDKNVLVKSLEEERTKILSSLGQAHMDKESLRKELEVVKGNRNREDREIRKVMVSPENGNFHRQHRSTGIEHASKEKEKKKKDVNPIDLSADLDD